MDAHPLRAELERLADLLEQAAASVRLISQTLEVGEPPGAPAGTAIPTTDVLDAVAPVTGPSDNPPPERIAAPEYASAPEHAPAQEAEILLGALPPVPPSSEDLERLIPAAAGLLRGEPDRIWRGWELVRSILDTADSVKVDWSQALIDGLVRRLIVRGFLAKPAPDRYRAVVGEEEEAEEPVGSEGEIARLEREIDGSMPHLGTLASSVLKAQVAIWGARARVVQDTAPGLSSDWEKRLSRIFGRLGTIVRRHRCGWVDTLNRQWSTDWLTYIAVQRGRLTDLPPDLTREQEEEFVAAELKGLLAPGRVVEPAEPDVILLDALEVLGDDHPLVAEALGRFGDPRLEAHPAARLRRRKRSPWREEAEEAAEVPEVPAAVLALTRGRRALIAGGQGSREEQRRSLEEALQFSSLDWETIERGRASPLQRMAERIRGGTYDFVFFLAAFTSHKGTVVVDACREAGVPLVYLNRGYNLTRIVREIEEQLAPE
jgi:hypothetical protein